jgi:GAF domain-containing protein
MFTCTQCGQDLPDKANFCPQCGSRTNGERGESAIQQRLIGISRAMNSTLDLDTLLKEISICACELTHAETGSTMLYDSERDELYFKVALGEKEDILRRLTVRDGIAWWVFTNGLPAIVNDTASDSRFTGTVDKVTSFDTRNILCVPIILDTGYWTLDTPRSNRERRNPGSSIQYPASIIGVIEVINKQKQPLKMSNQANEQSCGSAPFADLPHLQICPFTVEDQRILSIFAYQAAIAVRNAKAVGDGRNFFINAIEVFVTAIESTGFVPPGHCMRVARNSMGIAHKLGIENDDLHNLYYASALHDIGLLDIRCKPVTRDALRVTGIPESHTIIGAEMVRPVNLLAGTESIIRHHHEAWDGSGYPDGIGGDDIPLGARIVAVAESYEEIGPKIARRETLNVERREFIAANAGRLFAPDVVDAFLEILVNSQ